MLTPAQVEAYVCQSNLIEGIGFDPQQPTTSAHIQATKLVMDAARDGNALSARQVHETLMAGVLLTAGQYRTVAVEVAFRDGSGRRSQPLPEYVPGLMLQWQDLVESTVSVAAFTVSEKQPLCDICYYHFLCIHPFVDGNGRTGRLLHNALRLRLGLPWFTFTNDVHGWYVKKLRHYEDEVFKSAHADCY